MMKYQFPRDRYYDRVNHMWVRQEQDTGHVLIGLDALGLESLGDLAYITLPPVGEPIVRGNASGTLEAAKMTGEFVAPVSGRVIARNEDALKDPSLINLDCYGRGWLLSVELDDWKTQCGEMIHGESVDAWAQSEVERYRQQGWIHVD